MCCTNIIPNIINKSNHYHITIKKIIIDRFCILKTSLFSMFPKVLYNTILLTSINLSCRIKEKEQ